MMDNRPEFPMVWLGLAKVGIVTALLNTSARGRVLQHALEQTGACALIYGRSAPSAWPPSTPRELPPAVLDSVPRSRGGFAGAATLAGLDAPWRAVSGGNPSAAPRAGAPRRSALLHLHLRDDGAAEGGAHEPPALPQCRRRDRGPFGAQARADVLYNVLPLYHGAGGMVVVSAALHLGIPIVLRRRFSASEFWDDVREHQVTAWYYIGELCRYLLNQPPRADDREHTLRRMSGAGLKADVWRAVPGALRHRGHLRGLGLDRGELRPHQRR